MDEEAGVGTVGKARRQRTDSRAEMLAAQLRQNLRRRKAQARARAASAEGAPDEEPPPRD